MASPGGAVTRNPSGPGYLNAHSGAGDSRRKAAMIFGGADERQVLGDLWQYRLGRWRRVARTGPPPRTFAAVSYDSRRDRLVVVGGNRVLFGPEGATDTLLDDHWEWDGQRWHRFAGPRPPGRTEACCAFDSARGRLLLFGGWRWQDGQRVRLDDLWEFDGERWIQSGATGPEPRSGAAMTFDSTRRRILLAGGNGPRNDFWSFDGDNWEKLADLPQARFNPVVAFDRARGQSLLFGGWTGKERIAATALFDGEKWHSPAGPGPAARNHSVLVPSGDGTRLLLVGGHDGEQIFADQWEWDGVWRPLQVALPKARLDNGH